MPYNLTVFVDGACRGNGKPGAKAAAAAFFPRWRGGSCSRRLMGGAADQTNQRAELDGFILAMEMALEKKQSFDGRKPFLIVWVKTDSKYVQGCMVDWLPKWEANGFKNARGQAVANQDLIMKAIALRDQVERRGRVIIMHIPREENEIADKMANDCLDSPQMF